MNAVQRLWLWYLAMSHCAVIAIVAFSPLAWCQMIPQKRAEDLEKILNRDMAERIESLTPRITDAVVNEYLAGVTRRVSDAGHARLPIVVRVVWDDQPRAGILPGGLVYLSTGLMFKISTEAEVVGVIAHEIGHIPGGLLIRSASGTMPMFFAGGPWGICTRFEKYIVWTRVLRDRATDLERDADTLAIRYAYDAGYEPDALWDLVSRLDRSAVLPSESGARFAARQYSIVTTSAFEEMKARLPLPAETRPVKPTLFRSRDTDDERPKMRK